MSAFDARSGSEGQKNQHLLATLHRLLTITPTGVADALNAAANQVADALRAEKSDAFLYEQADELLVAVGTSATPMGQREHELGLHRLAIAAGGRCVEVFTTHTSFRSGYLEQDPRELLGITRDLGVRSTIATPLDVAGETWGVLQATSSQPNWFSEQDLRFLEAVAHWLSLVTRHAALMERAGVHADEPLEPGWRQNLLRWKVQRLTTDYQALEVVLKGLAAGFAEAREELSQMQAALQARDERISTLSEDLTHERAAMHEATRVRLHLEEQLRHAEETLVRLRNEGQEDHQDDR